jgi:hypothetical protein
MRRVIPILVSAALLALLILPVAASAADFGVRTGFYSEANEGYVGAEVLVNMSRSWFFNPNAEYVFIDNGTLMTFNGDVHYDFEVNGPTYVWAGGGPAVILRDPDFPRRSDRETELGVNLLAGIGWRASSVVPYLQGKVTLSDNNEAAVAFGVRF